MELLSASPLGVLTSLNLKAPVKFRASAVPESGLKPNKKIQHITRSIKIQPSPANHS